nr:zinc finger BED domain-containing protein RICESLEEPER 2-like [Tanacetum cinerariifolium]
MKSGGENCVEVDGQSSQQSEHEYINIDDETVLTPDTNEDPATFSAGGRVIDPYQSALKSITAEMLLYGGDWIRQNYEVKKSKVNYLLSIPSVREDEYSTKDCSGSSMLRRSKLAIGRLVNGSSCDGINMVIKYLDLEPKDIVVEFCSPSQWKELSKETSSKILSYGDGSFWKMELDAIPVALVASGENDVDVLKRAQSIYRDEHKGVAFCQEDAWAILKFHPKWDAPEQVDLTGDVLGATQEDLPGKPRPAKKTKSDVTASTGESNALIQFGELMKQELRLKREAAEKDRTLMRLEELRFLATSTKDLNDADAYWIKKQKRLI